MATTLITYHDISLALGGNQLFSHFNFSIAHNDKVLIKGPSGCGKTSLLNLVPGFLQPDTGYVMVENEKVNASNVWDIRKKVTLVSQDLQMGGGNVKEFIKEVLDYKANQPIDYSQEKVLEWFGKFQLPASKLDQEIGELSGGEKQRLALVIALLLDREVYLLDEVTSAIDDELKATVIDHLASMENKTVVAVSHDKHWEDYDFEILDIGKL